MQILVITPPLVEPVSVAEALFELKITADPDADADDYPQAAEVARQIRAAREDCERLTRRAFVQQTLRLIRGPARSGEYDRPSFFGSRPWPRIELLRPPLISVSAVRYYGDDNILTTADPSSYYVVDGLVPRLVFSNGAWPSLYIREDAIQVEYIAGYPIVPGDPDASPAVPDDLVANVPATVKTAILMGVRLQSDYLTPAQREALAAAQASLLAGLSVPKL